MEDYYFQMKDLSVGYNGNSLIHDINIGINKGEIVTLIGPNGSGKSTILKSITRQLKVVGGNVFFDDTSLLKLPYKELASKMAVVLTDRIKTELMTCHDIVATGRYPYTGRLGILTQEDEHLDKNSVEFHSHIGYRLVGEFYKCGYKFNRWYNMIWMEKLIGEHLTDQKPPKFNKTR